MLFRDIIGQDKIKNQLVRMVSEDRVAHALLFAGRSGVGSFQLALAFARFLSCTSRQANDACGRCPSCVKYDKLVHPDLHFVYPLVRKENQSSLVCDDVIDEWRDLVTGRKYFTANEWYAMFDANKQGLIYTSESQEIFRKLSMKTYEGRYKIMIIWLPEKMHVTAANKLLKLLEEPPAGTIFLLVSENPVEILTTILSRTQMIKVPGIDEDSLSAYLLQKFDISPEFAQKMARVSGGSLTAAVEGVTQNEVKLEQLDMFKSMMRICYSRKMPDIITFVDRVAALSRDSFKNFLGYAEEMIRENFVMNQGDASLVYMMPDEEAFASRFAPFIHEGNVLEISEELNLGIAHVEQNGNSKIIMMDLMLKLTMLLMKPKPQ